MKCWECPTCKYLMADIEYTLVKFDKCPRCNTSLAYFHLRDEKKKARGENHEHTD